MRSNVLLAIPVYNEARSLVRVIRDAQRHCSDILVVDDGSTDHTPRILESLTEIRVLTHAENRGYGKSLSDAFRFAEQHGYDWLITMDADEQHEADQIPRFVAAARRNDADVISGTRYPHGWTGGASVPPDRLRINKFVTELLNARLGLCLTDAFCGFKAYRVASLRHIHITVPGYAMPMQMWVQTARANLRVCELPVRLIYHDPTRHFGGMLDDPTARLQHYLAVLDAELSAARTAPDSVANVISP